MLLEKTFFAWIFKSNTFIPFGHSISEEEVNKNCSKIGSGLYCLEKLMRDNWTIKDDYPW